MSQTGTEKYETCFPGCRRTSFHQAPTECHPSIQDQFSSIEGVGKETPIETNAHGGSQSSIPYRLDLLDSRAILEVGKVLKEGADKYGANNWRKIPTEDHLNHLLMHTLAWLAGDNQDDHLSHIVCRAMFALGVELQPKQETVYSDD